MKKVDQLSFDYLDHYTMKQNRLKVLKASNYQCAICGGKATEIHHKDGSVSNHDIKNLMPVCHKCHMKFHSQKRKKPEINPEAIEYLLAKNGLDKKDLAKLIGMTHTAISTILKRKTTKNSTIKKIADALRCPIEAILAKPYEISFDDIEEAEILRDVINDRVNSLSDDPNIQRLYKVWLTKDLREHFKVKSYSLIRGEMLEEAIVLIKTWEPGGFKKSEKQTQQTA
ncbi:helix-turn-helix domain-containing protein [Thermoanaerobacterium sp. DL9XJH110]|uniref:helix-turn-helix domain-containing protein n=1 Tax=Thermoanaerobacterium sp. DL9XJH110 TaxID=3386643 RepID=UPI003BB5F9C2